MPKILYFFLLAVLVSCATNNKLGQKLLSEINISSDDPTIPHEFKSGEIMATCEAAIDQAQGRFDAVANMEPAKRNFDNTVLAAEKALADFDQITSPLYFMKEVHRDEKIRKEALECVEKMNVFMVNQSTRRDLYLAHVPF